MRASQVMYVKYGKKGWLGEILASGKEETASFPLLYIPFCLRSADSRSTEEQSDEGLAAAYEDHFLPHPQGPTTRRHAGGGILFVDTGSS